MYDDSTNNDNTIINNIINNYRTSNKIKEISASLAESIELRSPSSLNNYIDPNLHTMKFNLVEDYDKEKEHDDDAALSSLCYLTRLFRRSHTIVFFNVSCGSLISALACSAVFSPQLRRL